MTLVFDDARDAGDSWTGEVDAVFGAELVEAVVDPCVVETEAGEDDADGEEGASWAVCLGKRWEG